MNQITSKSVYRLENGESTLLVKNNLEYESAIQLCKDYPTIFKKTQKNANAIIVSKI